MDPFLEALANRIPPAVLSDARQAVIQSDIFQSLLRAGGDKAKVFLDHKLGEFIIDYMLNNHHPNERSLSTLDITMDPRLEMAVSQLPFLHAHQKADCIRAMDTIEKMGHVIHASAYGLGKTVINLALVDVTARMMQATAYQFPDREYYPSLYITSPMAIQQTCKEARRLFPDIDLIVYYNTQEFTATEFHGLEACEFKLEMDRLFQKRHSSQTSRTLIITTFDTFREREFDPVETRFIIKERKKSPLRKRKRDDTNTPDTEEWLEDATECDGHYETREEAISRVSQRKKRRDKSIRHASRYNDLEDIDMDHLHYEQVP
ncbi:hypothetical protein B0I35DRAFT_480550 [Stachybotrys elegans]|uniref:SNF2 N-terminal domain-containing protein n=1 Tax=Stachybotrys elegans TaxID=80388 RepID=A0A8K0WR90_9HYPO|nr:hypothetical protein B0I35DRAFT_480550 [Stachybotrys elegans]